ncbi:MAG: hypothetical protein LBV72_00365 [Tannerella sp.]|jgi:hypothetical protein|nr:hypothetical protein [Tannerella sp.]
MKKSIIVLVSFLLLLSCSNKVEDPSEDIKNESLMEARGYPDNSSTKFGKIGLWIEAKSAIIDWGDGIKDEVYLNGSGSNIEHFYNNANYQKVKIYASELKKINFNKDGLYYEVDIKKAPFLTHFVGDKDMRKIEFDYIPNIIHFDIENGKFDESDLNSIFNNLPTVDAGVIRIGGNPGRINCKTAIAINKGWDVKISI